MRIWILSIGVLAFLILIWVGKNTLLDSDDHTEGMVPYGIEHPNPATVLRILPEAKKHPLLLEFKTKLCFDCKQLNPLLLATAKQYPKVLVITYDLETDKRSRPEIFSTFKPVTVPTIVTFKPGGVLKDVLYGVPTKTALNTAFKSLSSK